MKSLITVGSPTVGSPLDWKDMGYITIGSRTMPFPRENLEWHTTRQVAITLGAASPGEESETGPTLAKNRWGYLHGMLQALVDAADIPADEESPMRNPR